jgi:hypothetical protein
MSTSPNAVERSRRSMQKTDPNNLYAGPTIRPDTSGLRPVRPGVSRPTTHHYNQYSGSNQLKAFQNTASNEFQMLGKEDQTGVTEEIQES